MEAILTAIVAIVLIAVGIMAFYYFYGVSHALINVVKTRLLVYSLQNLLSGISTKLDIPYLKCDKSDIVTVKITKIITQEIKIVYKINNVIKKAYWGDTSKCVQVNPWLWLGPNCVKIDFIKIFYNEYDECRSSSKCVLTFYALVRGIKTESGVLLGGYIKETVREFIIRLLKGQTLQILVGENTAKKWKVEGPKIVLVRVVFLEPVSYSLAG